MNAEDARVLFAQAILRCSMNHDGWRRDRYGRPVSRYWQLQFWTLGELYPMQEHDTGNLRILWSPLSSRLLRTLPGQSPEYTTTKKGRHYT